VLGCQDPGCLLCSRYRALGVKWVSRSGGSFRGFCCVRGVKVRWCFGGVTIAIGCVAALALGSPRAVDPGAGVPRAARSGSSACGWGCFLVWWWGLVVVDLRWGCFEVRCEAADAGGGPSHKLTCIGHLHHFGRSQRLRRCMSCRFMSCHSVTS
jgi:hypothetical protein